MTRLRVLLSAYACEPGEGSEPGVGWNVAMHLARLHDVTVVTRSNNRSSIEAALEGHTGAAPDFVYYDLPRWSRFWKRGQRGVRLYYYLWQVTLYRGCLKALAAERSFDICHHVTFVKYWTPTTLWKTGIPFIWGPVGGGEDTPKGLRRSYSARWRIWEFVRGLGRWLGERDPFVRATVRRAAVIFATTEESASRIRALGGRNVLVLGESGLTAEELKGLGRMEAVRTSASQFVSVGRLLHLKGFHLGLMAFAQAGIAGSTYGIIGSGPYERELRELASDLGIAEQVSFLGRLPRDSTLAQLSQADVLVHPSLHDSGGWVCLEAMAAGKPQIVVDCGGPGYQVSPETGFAVRPAGLESTVTELAAAMIELSRADGTYLRMSRACRREAEDRFAWQSKVAEYDAAYCSVVGADTRA